MSSIEHNSALLLERWQSAERLIKMWANQYITTTETRLFDFDDLCQAGFLAIVDTVQMFDPEKGSFNTLLRYHIRRRFAEVSSHHGTKQRPELHSMSLDESISDETGITRGDLLHDPGADFEDDLIEAISDRQDAAAILKEIVKLPEQQRTALLLTTLNDLTLVQAAKHMNITPAAVRQHRIAGAQRVRRTRTGAIIAKEYIDYSVRHVSLQQYKTTGVAEPELYLLMAEERRKQNMDID